MSAAEWVYEALHEYLDHSRLCDQDRCSTCTVLFHRVRCGQSLWYLEKAKTLKFNRSEKKP